MQRWQVKVNNSGSQVRRYGPCVKDVTVECIEVPADTMRDWQFEWKDWMVDKARAIAMATVGDWFLTWDDAPHWYSFIERDVYKDADRRTIRFIAHRPYAD